jgi:hypothetical protein
MPGKPSAPTPRQPSDPQPAPVEEPGKSDPREERPLTDPVPPEGDRLTVFPASALRFSENRSDIRMLPVDMPMARLPNGIVTLKNRAVGPVVQLFIDSARDAAKRLKR